MKTIMKLHTKIVTGVFLCLLGYSCSPKDKQEISLLRESLRFSGIAYGEPAGFFPLTLKCYKTKDSITYITCGQGLYNQLNIEFCKYDTFADLLVKQVEFNGGYLVVDSAFLNCNRSFAIVTDDRIQSCYKEKGIDGIVKEYVSQQSYLMAHTPKEQSYLIYLLYQHRILCRLLDLPIAMYVDFDMADEAEKYRKIISENRRLDLQY